MQLISLVAGLAVIQAQDPLETQFKLASEGRKAALTSDHKAAISYFRQAIEAGSNRATTWYDLACSLALNGDKEGAFRALSESAKQGFTNHGHASQDSDLNSLHGDPRWQPFLDRIKKTADREARRQSNPANAKIVFDDVRNFMRAYDAAKGKPAADRIQTYYNLYYKKATPGLLDFEGARGVTPTKTDKVVSMRPAFFEHFRNTKIDFAKHRGELMKAFAKMKDLVGDGKFPNVYFVVGLMNTGGTTGPHGLLMGAEMFVRTPTMPDRELGDWQKGAIMGEADIVPLVTHEAAHYQQGYGPSNTLLAQVIKEGAADFLAHLCVPQLTSRSEAAAAYGRAHEKELWEKFKVDMSGTDTKGWLYGDGWAPGVPSDMGYWMGEQICAAYYAKAVDKKAAMKEILHTRDFEGFLKASGYNGGA